MELELRYKPIDTESKFNHKAFTQAFGQKKGLETTLEEVSKDPTNSATIGDAGIGIWGKEDFYKTLENGAMIAREDLGYWTTIGTNNLDTYTIKNAKDLYKTLESGEKNIVTLSAPAIKIEKVEVKDKEGKIDEKKTSFNKDYNAFADAVTNQHTIRKISEIEDKVKGHQQQVNFIQKNSNMSPEWANFMASRFGNDKYTAQVFREYEEQSAKDYAKAITNDKGEVDEKKFGKYMDTNFELQVATPTREFLDSFQAMASNAYMRIEAEKPKE